MRDPNLTGYTPKATPGVTPVDTQEVTSRVVTCDGGGGALGHPGVSLRIEDKQVTCPYCSRTFILQDGAGGGDHH
ncbi:zinc-finger domain-containing protein [Roseomonas sp. 18066]|uniref:zinc-finger domain-containing protein n=1 Tax=Roseomonas sp. 18066 TaxID=2681412 RepID=UPI00135C56B1|nr:zinc-finger domain-containing protein [Roseomonas sp. 18066]